ncbi:MAG: YkvA family protein [Thomasclavelia sp.]|uniref:YkvA family protein n=1 Tax=Thomasclavelia sp. TaxID=3025757 RepID=UPI0039A306F0
MNLKEKARKLKSDIPIVYLSLKDKETPIIAKVLAMITIVYALSPIDLIPDFIPILGYIDDVIILPLLVILTCKLIPKDIWQKNQKKAKGLWENGKPKRWYYSIPIILIWILIIIMLMKL